MIFCLLPTPKCGLTSSICSVRASNSSSISIFLGVQYWWPIRVEQVWVDLKSGCWVLVSSQNFVELPMNQMLSSISCSIVLEIFEDKSRVGCKLSVCLIGLTTGVYLSIGHFERRILPLNHYYYPTTTASITTKRRILPLPSATTDPLLLPVSQQPQQKTLGPKLKDIGHLPKGTHRSVPLQCT